MKKKMIIIAFISILIDQVVKMIIDIKVTSLVVIPKFLSLIYIRNAGVAFSMLKGSRLFIIFTTIILLIILYYIMKDEYLHVKDKTRDLYDITFGILYGGIIGNLLDRIIRGEVIDYISVNIFGYLLPVFNIADVLITIGMISLIIIHVNNNSKSKSEV